MQTKDRRFLIIGAGRSGVAAARFLSKENAQALLCDTKEPAQLQKEGYGAQDAALLPGITAIFGRQPTEEEVASCDALILSPGAPPDIPPCVMAQKHHIPIYSEIEFANAFYRGSVVAITGTNGKTTTTTLAGELFRNAGFETYVGGNIGDPFLNYAKQAGEDSVMALEISSFQLSLNRDLHPKIAVITNITPDHLDRHKTMENYIAAKANVFANMEGDDCVILNYDDENVRALAPLVKCRVFWFTLQNDPKQNAYLCGDQIMFHVNGDAFPLIGRKELKLIGAHNAANVMCASLAAFLYGAPLSSIRDTLREFSPVEHRMEFVRELHGVTYINDSKGTNPEATMTALAAVDAPIVLILGGYDKKSDFDELFKLVVKKVKHCVVLGATAPKICAAAQENGYKNVTIVHTYKEAVNLCDQLAAPGDCVLLSPACASWDMFENYEIRGEVFKELVRGL